MRAVDAARSKFQSWRSTFETRPNVQDVLKQLRQTFPEGTSSKPTLEDCIMAACFNARAFQDAPENDDYVRWQSELAALRKQQPELQEHIRSLRIALASHPRQLSMAISAGAGGLHSLPLQGHRTTYAQKMGEALTALANGLERLLSVEGTEPGLLYQVAGCLRYPENVFEHRYRGDAALNCLAFELALLFKVWSARQTTYVPRPSPWIDEGKPHYEFVATFANEALDIAPDKVMTSRNVLDRLSDLRGNHPGIEYIGWNYNLVGNSHDL